VKKNDGWTEKNDGWTEKNGGWATQKVVEPVETTLLNHYDKLETTEISQLTMDNGQWTIDNGQWIPKAFENNWQVSTIQWISKVWINILLGKWRRMMVEPRRMVVERSKRWLSLSKLP